MAVRKMSVLFFSAAMAVLIFDAKTAIVGCSEGIEMCLRQLIPSLFPFLVISGCLTASLNGIQVPVLSPIEKLCRIPSGSAVLLLTGLVGGYPVGARAVSQSYRQGNLTREEAERMLPLCNHAGPSFLFGIMGSYFDRPSDIFILWGLLILSSLIAVRFLPGASFAQIPHLDRQHFSMIRIMEQSVRTMGLICGWVILFRILLNFLQRWILWLFPAEAQIVISGFLELTNGCLMLPSIKNQTLRFLLAGVILSFGGLSITMQTAAVSQGLRLRCYAAGKGLQTFFFAVLALHYSLLKFENNPFSVSHVIFLDLAVAVVLVLFRNTRKNTVAFRRTLMYNR